MVHNNWESKPKGVIMVLGAHMRLSTETKDGKVACVRVFELLGGDGSRRSCYAGEIMVPDGLRINDGSFERYASAKYDIVVRQDNALPHVFWTEGKRGLV